MSKTLRSSEQIIDLEVIKSLTAYAKAEHVPTHILIYGQD